MARPRRRPGNLPAELTSFIGRRRELAEVRSKLGTARLVSLVGPGGVGKTRLALRSAADLGRGFADGAWVAELGEVRDGPHVANAVMTALDLRDQAAQEPAQTVTSYLRDRQLLLLLDNCEHVLEAAAHLVLEILRAAPSVHVLATSREPLQVPGEYVVAVPPLELPQESERSQPSQLLQNEAIALFAERAGAASGNFELTPVNQDAVIAICRRLDGLPLAIELAAVRTRVLSVEQILDRLADRFALLTGAGRAALPRHQTLRTTIDWSFDLLTESEQKLLRRLCVFAGRFTLEDVEAICAFGAVAASGVFQLLASLVEKSLVTKEDARGTASYRLHETMREYASTKLREAGEETGLTERCTDYYRARCLEFEHEARYRLVDWLSWADMEIDTIRAALLDCLSRGAIASGLDIAVGLRFYWVTRGTTEGVDWLDRLLASGETVRDSQGRAYYLRGWLSLIQGEPAEAVPWVQRAEAEARRVGQPARLSEVLSLAAMTADGIGDPAGASRLLDEAGSAAAGLDDYPAAIELIQARAVHAFFQGDLDSAVATSIEGERLSRQAGDLFLLESMLRNLGTVALMTGDLEGSRRRFAEALRVAKQTDHRIAQFYLLAALALHSANAGEPRLAARLFGAADTLRTTVGADIVGPHQSLLADARDSAVMALGQKGFDTDYQAGRRLLRQEAIAMALGEQQKAGRATGEHPSSGPLAKREAEVARLIADGLTNKEIGARLFISERTVASHVASIMNKLGFNSRAQIATWVTSSRA